MRDTTSKAPDAVPRTTTPPPTFAVDRLRTSLLPPEEIAPHAKIHAPTLPGLTEGAVPSCSVSSVPLPGRPTTLARQLESRKPGYVATTYIQLIAVYPNASDAGEAMARVRAKATACPAKRHFPAKRRGKKLIATEHTDSWAITEDTVADWAHLRGSEKLVAPPSASKFNVFYNVYDYATRGNVFVATLYWDRVSPNTSGKPTADRATAILTKQLQKFG